MMKSLTWVHSKYCDIAIPIPISTTLYWRDSTIVLSVNIEPFILLKRYKTLKSCCLGFTHNLKQVYNEFKWKWQQ